MAAESARKSEFPPRHARMFREEKIFIYFEPRGTPATKGHAAAGDWVVSEGRKPVSPGQTITWQVVGNVRKFELDLPEIFEPRQIVVDCNIAQATVSANAEPGLFLYEAYVNDQLATGGSAPGVIVDP